MIFQDSTGSLLSSKFKSGQDHSCGGDGYAESFDATKSKPVTWSIPTAVLAGATIKNAFLQIFIDYFQAVTFCLKFQRLLNGKRFIIEGEKILNAIDQTGPVGKLITIPITEEYYEALSAGTNMTMLIDQTTGAADGFAIDFARLLINRKRESSCRGAIRGKVLEKGTYVPVVRAKVSGSDKVFVETNSEGEFELKNMPTGLEVLGASATGYADGTATADIGQGSENEEVIIFLVKGKAARFDNKQVMVVSL